MLHSTASILVRFGLMLSFALSVPGVWAKDGDNGPKKRGPGAGNGQPGGQVQQPQPKVQPRNGGNPPGNGAGRGQNQQQQQQFKLPPKNQNNPPAGNQFGKGNGNGGNKNVIQQTKDNKPNFKPPGNNPKPGGGNNNPNFRAGTNNNNPGNGNNNGNFGGQKNKPNMGGGNNNNPGGPKNLNPPQFGNKPGSNSNVGNAGGNNPGPKIAPRNPELKNHLQQFPHDNVKRQNNEQNLVRNKDHVQDVLNKNPNLKNQVQGQNGQVDLAKLHMAHETQGRIPSVVHKNGALPVDLKSHPDLSQQYNQLGKSKNLTEFNQHLRHFQDPAVLKQHPELAKVNWNHVSGQFQNQLTNNTFHNLAASNVGNQLNLTRQFNLYQHGDVARQMNLNVALINHGGWGNRYVGPIYPGYTRNSFSFWYAGAGFYPRYCWCPTWCPWVDWCWWNTCPPFYDPRPFACRPYFYNPSPVWVAYQYPVWQPMPVVASGTWVDLPTTTIVSGVDLQLVAVRFIDNGHPEQNLGSRYRVWAKNNSQVAITSPFNILLMASNTPDSAADLPQAGVTIPSLDPGELQAVDVRLPLAANQMNLVDDHKTPFNYLHVLVDSHRQLQDVNLANNGTVIARADILPVDPAAFAPDVSAAAPGAMVSVAGEGFGPEPGRIIVNVNGTQTEATVYGWYDLGVQFELPAVPVTAATDAEVLIVRGDGAASNPVTVRLAPENKLAEAALPPAPLP